MATTKTLAPTNQTITIAAFSGEKPDHRQIADAETKMADAVNALNSQISNMFPLKSQSGYSTSQTIENFLDTLPTNESWMTTITANGSTGDIVTLSSQHLFYIVQMAVGNSNNRFQLALAINTPKLYVRAKLWWGTWTSWTLV